MASLEEDRKRREEIIENAVTLILEAMDEDEREGLKNTPKRVAKMYLEEVLRNGDPLEKALATTFVEEAFTRELVVVKDIPFLSWCEHHMLPYVGRASIGYYPSKSVIGLSKMARLVTAASRGFTIQERVTDRIANALVKVLEPIGVSVRVEAIHMCMIVRGVKALGSSTVTVASRGSFLESNGARAELANALMSGGINGLSSIF